MAITSGSDKYLLFSTLCKYRFKVATLQVAWLMATLDSLAILPV
jgi:hypothetical protein